MTLSAAKKILRSGPVRLLSGFVRWGGVIWTNQARELPLGDLVGPGAVIHGAPRHTLAVVSVDAHVGRRAHVKPCAKAPGVAVRNNH